MMSFKLDRKPINSSISSELASSGEASSGPACTGPEDMISWDITCSVGVMFNSGKNRVLARETSIVVVTTQIRNWVLVEVYAAQTGALVENYEVHGAALGECPEERSIAPLVDGRELDFEEVYARLMELYSGD